MSFGVHDCKISVAALNEVLLRFRDWCFDKNLTFDNHVVKTVSSCMSALGQISRVKHVFNEYLRITIINALVLVNCTVVPPPYGQILLIRILLYHSHFAFGYDLSVRPSVRPPLYVKPI